MIYTYSQLWHLLKHPLDFFLSFFLSIVTIARKGLLSSLNINLSVTMSHTDSHSTLTINYYVKILYQFSNAILNTIRVDSQNLFLFQYLPLNSYLKTIDPLHFYLSIIDFPFITLSGNSHISLFWLPLFKVMTQDLFYTFFY